jgi:hypothetical protein
VRNKNIVIEIVFEPLLSVLCRMESTLTVEKPVAKLFLRESASNFSSSHILKIPT